MADNGQSAALQIVDTPTLITWENALQPLHAKVKDFHFAAISQRFLIAMRLPKPLDIYDLDILQDDGILLDIDPRGDLEQTLANYGQNVLAVYDYVEPKPLGIQVGALNLRAAFKHALHEEYYADITKFGFPADNAYLAYKFEKDMVNTYAPEALKALSSEEARQLVFRIARDYGIMAPDIEIKSLKQLRAEFDDSQKTVAYFSNEETTIGAGKLVLTSDVESGYPEGYITTNIILHEMAHALTLGRSIGPAHGHSFLHNLASLYDGHSNLDKETFLLAAAQRGLIASHLTCPPALSGFDVSLQRNYARLMR